MRRLVALITILMVILVGCNAARQPAAPPVSGGDAPGPGAATPAVGPSGELGVTVARDGKLQRVQIRAGQAIDREGLFFMKVATSDIEGWVFTGEEFGGFPTPLSEDNRWLGGQVKDGWYLADRSTGAVYKWNGEAGHVIAARGDAVLFVTKERFYVTADALRSWKPVEIASDIAARALFAPDGRSLVLAARDQVFLVDAGSGQALPLGKLDAPGTVTVYPNIFVTAGPRGESVVAGAYYSDGGRSLVRTLRYSWQGKLLEERTDPGLPQYSPDGRLAAWHGGILGLTATLTVGSTDLQPQVRMKGEMRCNLPFQGPYWLPDGSGLVVSTTRGPRLLKVDGTLETLDALKVKDAWGVPVPAKDRPNLFAVGGKVVMDGSGKRLAEAVPTSPGKWLGVAAIEPWGERSDEVRFALRSSGKGVGCDPPIFPPEAERAPFPTYAGLMVKVAAGDCVNLRQAVSKESSVIACLPNSTRLTEAYPPGTNNKGELSKWGPVMSTDMGGGWWWYVRTPQGQRGWVSLSDEYLAWDVARPGDPAPDPLLRRIQDEITNMRWWLRVALGEERCGANCSNSEGFVEPVWGQMTWCKTGPAEMRADPAFDPARHGPALTALENGCSTLVKAPERRGQLDETAAWKQQVREILTALPN